MVHIIYTSPHTVSLDDVAHRTCTTWSAEPRRLSCGTRSSPPSCRTPRGPCCGRSRQCRWARDPPLCVRLCVCLHVCVFVCGIGGGGWLAGSMGCRGQGRDRRPMDHSIYGAAHYDGCRIPRCQCPHQHSRTHSLTPTPTLTLTPLLLPCLCAGGSRCPVRGVAWR